MAPSQKRKREGEHVGGGDGDDAPYGPRQILPVANLPIDFDSEPADGMQYLFTVRRNARRLPSVTRVANPYARISPPLAQSEVRASTETQGDVEPPSLLPSKEWRSEFERHFRNFRGNTSQPIVQPRSAGPLERMMPDRKNRDAWWAFIEGAPESVWNPPRMVGQGTECNLQWHAAAQPCCITTFDNVAPQRPRELSSALLFQLDHRFSLHLVMYFTHWFNSYLDSLDGNSKKNNDTSTTAYTPTDVHMRWVFALLTRVDIFCSADEISCLRNLARACQALISVVRRRNMKSSPLSAYYKRPGRSIETDPSKTETNVVMSPENSFGTLSECSMWFVFCAVASVWGQRDLWSDAEEALRQNP
ncbi:hypothetical protein B0F90DRAFT_1686026 [Multifurca ochricompacta]|uniref:Uncharacterized protein n=1 Tax=Multifurca ochricompacta TaxID=376703 RepID=A0AAD4MBM4_9AGAM|nr:hypothetical protein B0F90DRAFT_1686026 [Multifurca ochricompacta]